MDNKKNNGNAVSAKSNPLGLAGHFLVGAENCKLKTKYKYIFTYTICIVCCEGRLKACSKCDEFFFLFSSIAISSSVRVLYV
jgi:hypothetical protein